MKIKENVLRLFSVLSQPKTVATLQIAVATVTLFHAIKKFRDLNSDDA